VQFLLGAYGLFLLLLMLYLAGMHRSQRQLDDKLELLRESVKSREEES